MRAQIIKKAGGRVADLKVLLKGLDRGLEFKVNLEVYEPTAVRNDVFVSLPKTRSFATFPPT